MHDIASLMIQKWTDSPVVLRVDSEFAGALLNSNTDVELAPDWLKRFPFNAIAYSLATPVSLHDGHRLCHYSGMIVTGTNNVRLQSEAAARPIGYKDGPNTKAVGLFTRYVSIPDGQGVRCLWLFKEDGDPSPQLQSVTFLLRGPNAPSGRTLGEMISAQIRHAAESGQSEGNELPVLIPLSLSLLLYTAGSEQEIDWPPRDQISRPQTIRSAEIGNLGWRVGAVLRQYRDRPTGPDTGESGEVGLGGWRLPPHIRKAHWHRVRVVARDESGHVVGRRDGVEGVDWHYEVRWYPPTPVNAHAGIAPAVREP
ncbi:hypothetical protein MAUB1S_02956 [Mycolicibacterium aubagnense]